MPPQTLDKHGCTHERACEPAGPWHTLLVNVPIWLATARRPRTRTCIAQRSAQPLPAYTCRMHAPVPAPPRPGARVQRTLADRAHTPRRSAARKRPAQPCPAAVRARARAPPPPPDARRTCIAEEALALVRLWLASVAKRRTQRNPVHAQQSRPPAGVCARKRRGQHVGQRDRRTKRAAAGGGAGGRALALRPSLPRRGGAPALGSAARHRKMQHMPCLCSRWRSQSCAGRAPRRSAAPLPSSRCSCAPAPPPGPAPPSYTADTIKVWNGCISAHEKNTNHFCQLAIWPLEQIGVSNQTSFCLRAAGAKIHISSRDLHVPSLGTSIEPEQLYHEPSFSSSKRDIISAS